MRSSRPPRLTPLNDENGCMKFPMLWSYAPPAVSACKQIASAFISVYELVGAAKLVVVVPMPPRLVPGCCKWYLTL